MLDEGTKKVEDFRWTKETEYPGKEYLRLQQKFLLVTIRRKELPDRENKSEKTEGKVEIHRTLM